MNGSKMGCVSLLRTGRIRGGGSLCLPTPETLMPRDILIGTDERTRITESVGNDQGEEEGVEKEMKTQKNRT